MRAGKGKLFRIAQKVCFFVRVLVETAPPAAWSGSDLPGWR
jgi:hypothetical protein